VFLVGQTPTNYTLLRELDEGAAQKIIESKGGNETIASFKNSLANFMQNVKVQKASAVSTGRKV
jgi:flagellar biogenesis protein FliO